MRRRIQRPPSRLRFLTGWLAVLLYLLALSPAGAAVTALVAAASPDHELQIGGSGAGLALVLHHQGGGLRHQHGGAARLLVLLASSSSTSDPDHVIQFGASPSALREGRTEASAGAAKDAAALVLPGGLFSSRVSAPLPLAWFRPPADTGDPLRALRTTVLLV